MRLPLLLLALAALSYSAPIIKHEAEAQQFFSKIFSAFKENKMGKITKLMYEKYHHFMPGFWSEEELRTIMSAVDREESLERAKVNEASAIVDNEGSLQLVEEKTHNQIVDAEVKPRIDARFAALGKEARAYLEEAGSYITIYPVVTGNCGKAMDRLIAEFKALSKEAQGQLKQQFPVFGMLDEIRSYAAVLDRIVGGVKIVCAEIRDFHYCRYFM